MTEWRSVVGWEGFYEVSDTAQVRSVPRTITRSNGRPLTLDARVLKAHQGPSGHSRVSLNAPGRTESALVHRLVAKAFIPNPDNLPWVLHWDDDPTNNRVENLRWGTPKDNQADSARNGTNFNAQKTSCKRGHAFDEENTYHYTTIFGRPGRQCRACCRMRGSKRSEGLTNKDTPG